VRTEVAHLYYLELEVQAEMEIRLHFRQNVKRFYSNPAHCCILAAMPPDVGKGYAFPQPNTI
jgi:hypothetical protein